MKATTQTDSKGRSPERQKFLDAMHTKIMEATKGQAIMQAKQVGHTATPWHVQPIGSQRYVEAPHKMICDMQRDACLDEAEIAEQDANAAFIVRACNTHEELVGALEDCVEALARLPDTDGAYRVTCLQQAKKALVKAKTP